jgi:hypothetical protein
MDALGHRKFRRDLHRGPPSSTSALEYVDGEIAFYFIQGRAIPITEFSVFIEEGNFAPLTFIRHKLGTWDGPGCVEGAAQIGIAKTSEDAAKLVEKLGSVIVFLGCGDLSFALSVRIRPHEKGRHEE